jgi:ribosomal protein S18 acetylase RimI-like enzyme
MSDARSQRSTDVIVRDVAPADLPRVWEMLRGLATYEKLIDILTGDAEMLHDALFGERPERLFGLVAERDGRLIGYALYYPVFGSFRTRWRLYLEDLFVEPEARGSGAGVALMAELARRVQEGGYYSLDWEVIDWNTPSIEFYERLGSKRIATDWLRYRLEGDTLDAMARRGSRS